MYGPHPGHRGGLCLSRKHPPRRPSSVPQAGLRAHERAPRRPNRCLPTAGLRRRAVRARLAGMSHRDPRTIVPARFDGAAEAAVASLPVLDSSTVAGAAPAWPRPRARVRRTGFPIDPAHEGAGSTCRQCRDCTRRRNGKSTHARLAPEVAVAARLSPAERPAVRPARAGARGDRRGAPGARAPTGPDFRRGRGARCRREESGDRRNGRRD